MRTILSYDGWLRLFEAAEGKAPDEISALIEKAKTSDPDQIKSHPAYEPMLSWFGRPGPTKGRMDMDKDLVLKSMQYWTGDLSQKTGSGAEELEARIATLTDAGQVEKIKKMLPKIVGTTTSLQYDTNLITSSAQKIKDALDALHKSGKRISSKFSPSTSSNLTATTNHLGIMPWRNEDSYKLKDIEGARAKEFMNWYDSLKKGGVEPIITKINDPKHHTVKSAALDNDMKLKILNKIQEKSQKVKRPIDEALRLYFQTTGYLTTTTTTKPGTPAEAPAPKVTTMSFAFPYKKGNEEMAKTYFKDDMAELRDGMAGQMVNSINEIVKSLKAQGAKITKFSYRIIASTSNVPSYYLPGNKRAAQSSTENNKTLVADRAKVLEAEIKQAIESNGLTEISETVPALLTPNNTLDGKADWNKVKDQYQLKTKADGTKGRVNAQGQDTTAAYESLFGPARHSGAAFEIEYTITETRPEVPEAKPETETTTIGNWTVNISWHKDTIDFSFDKRTFQRIGYKIGKSIRQIGTGSGGNSVGDLCAAYGG